MESVSEKEKSASKPINRTVSVFQDTLGSVRDVLLVIAKKEPLWVYTETAGSRPEVDFDAKRILPSIDLNANDEWDIEIGIDNDGIEQLNNFGEGGAMAKATGKYDKSDITIMVEKLPIFDTTDDSLYSCGIIDVRRISIFYENEDTLGVRPIRSLIVATDGSIDTGEIVRMVLSGANQRYNDKIREEAIEAKKEKYEPEYIPDPLANGDTEYPDVTTPSISQIN